MALVCLVILAAVNYGWSVFAPETRGIASKALDAGAILSLLWLVYSLKPSRSLGLVLLYGAFEQLQTVLCSIAYAFEPWEVPDGESICSVRIDLDIGAIGVILLAYTLSRISEPARSDRFQTKEKDL